MGRYDTSFYNSERYYDPTAGAAIIGTIRREKERREKEYRIIQRNESPREVNKRLEFARIFSDFYRRTFGPRPNGKTRRLSMYHFIRDQIHVYECCMRHVDDEDFSIEKIVRDMELGTDRRVRQIFSGTGNMGQLIRCYNQWLETGNFKWKSSDGCYWYKEVQK